MIAVASLFAYPTICVSIGIESSRALAFPARSVTLALATPVVKNLGILTPLEKANSRWLDTVGCGGGNFEWHNRCSCGTRNPETASNTSWYEGVGLSVLTVDDYVTRGVSLGTNASAISTAQLLTTDPRAAALSSLSFAYTPLIVLLTEGYSEPCWWC